MIKKVLLVLAIVSSVVYADFFEKGKTSVGVVVGNSSTAYDNYVIAGVSADYFVIDNLSLGLGYRGWFGGTHNRNQITVPVTYYIPLSEKFRPYAGAFVRQTFVSSSIVDDYESYGMRGGLTMALSRNSYIGVGVIQEYYSNGIFEDSSSTYPEFIFAFSF